LDVDMTTRTDAELATAAAAGEREALAAIFDRYGTRVYAFCRSMVHRPADADDCLQDVFVIAATRLGGLREPERLRSWLFSVARHECLHRLDRNRREVPMDEFEDGPHAAGNRPLTSTLDRDLADLLEDSIAGLADRDRLVIELSDRQGLSTEELAAALSMSAPSAHKLLTRARSTARKCVGALLVARTGRQDCPALDAVLGQWNGRLTPLLRKRIARHIETCRTCREQERRVASPAALLHALPVFLLPLPWLIPGGSGATGTPSLLPQALRDRILDAAGNAQAQTVGAAGGPAGGGPAHGGPAHSGPAHGGPAGGPGADPVGAGRNPAVHHDLGQGAGWNGNGDGAHGHQAGTARQPTDLANGPNWSGGWPPADRELRRAARGFSLPAALVTAAAALVVAVFLLARFAGPGPVDGQALPAADVTAASVPVPDTSQSTGPDGSTPSTTVRKTPTPRTQIPPPRTEPASTGETVPTTTVSTPSTITTATATSAPGGPEITQLSVSCEPSADGTYAPILTWTTANTDRVAVSVDNPDFIGSFGEYEPIGQLELPRNGCYPEYGQQIYTLYAFGSDGRRADRTIYWDPPTDLTAGTTPTTTDEPPTDAGTTSPREAPPTTPAEPTIVEPATTASPTVEQPPIILETAAPPVVSTPPTDVVIG